MRLFALIVLLLGKSSNAESYNGRSNDAMGVSSPTLNDANSRSCTDDLPSDYINSICYNTWNFKSCEKIAKMISGCNDLWKDTECSNHTGLVRDTCRKSCDPSCQESGPSGNVLEGSGLAVALTRMGDEYGNNEEVFGVDGMGGGNRLTSGSDVQASCEDVSKRCGALANPGKCKTDPSVQRYCKKSCGLCGWNKVAVRGRAWDDNQCSRLGSKIIIDGIKTEGKACKGYCNDFGSKRCNAINWNPQIARCIAWSCGKPIPIPTRSVLPGYEAYTREEQALGSGVGLTSMGGGHGNDEDAFGGNGIGVGNGQTSGIDSQGSADVQTRMGGGYENNEAVFGGDGMRGGNGLTSGSNVQGRACMLKECSMCEIKGHELWQTEVNDLERCKTICLTTFWCKGIDFGFNQCFLTREDVRVVGTKFSPMYTAYRVGTCSVEDRFAENTTLGEGQESPMLRTTLQGLWTENCKVGGLCGRGLRGGSKGTKCDTSDYKKDKDDYCGQCTYGWRRPWGNANDWCCTWTDFINKRDCKCQAEYAPECQKVSSITMSQNQDGMSFGSRFKTMDVIEDVDSDVANGAINEEGLLSAVQPTIPGGCLKDENMVQVTAKVEFSHKDDLERYSYREEILFNQTFQHERRKIEVGLKLGGAFELVTAALGLQYKRTVDRVAASAEYSHTEQGVYQSFKENIYHIHRKITTTVTINGKQATLVEEKFVDAVPKNDSITIDMWEKEHRERAKNYLKDNFGASDGEIDTSGLAASFGQAFCVLAAKCAGRGWQVNKETDPGDGGKIAIIGNFESAEECALRVYLEHPKAVGATWWTESAYTCEAIYNSTKLIDLRSTNTHNVKTCIFEGMSNSERNRVALNNGHTGTELIDSATTGAHENFTSAVPNGAECAAKCTDHGCGNFMCGGVNCGCASCEHGCPWKCGPDGKCPKRIPCMVPQCSMCEIKGSETKMPTINTLAHCKALCLKTSWCTGIDYSISDECYLNAEDVKVVGTKFDPFYKAFRKDTCLEGSQVDNGEESLVGASGIMGEANVMDGQRNGAHEIKGGYGVELEGGAGGLGVGYGSGFGSGNQGRHNLGMGANGGAPGKGRHCNPDEGEFNNARCDDGQRCIWEAEDSDISVGVCKNGSAVGLTRMGSAYGNDEEAFGGYGMGSYNGVTSGSDAQDYNLVKSGHECKSADENLGRQVSIADCARACRKKTGCNFFIFGTGSKDGICRWEKTQNADCSEGWEQDEYNFYEMKNEVYDCGKLPNSPYNSDKQKGCPGAVYSSGKPSREYCDGSKAYPWFEKCCKWENQRCLPKTPADACDKGKAEELIKVTSETEYFQRSFASYAESVKNTTWSVSYYKEYKGVEVGLTEEAGIAGKFSGNLALDIKKSVGQVSEDMSLSSNTQTDYVKFGDDLQLVRKMTTVISIGGNTMQTEEEIYEHSLPVSQRLSQQQLKDKAIQYMKETYDPVPSEIPYKNRALFQRSACAFVLPCKPVHAKAYQVGEAMQYNYKSPEICAYEVLKNKQTSVGVTFDTTNGKCWVHNDISIPLGKLEGIWRSCHFEGQCEPGYFSCHTCCEPREEDLCKCDKNNGAKPKTLYRPSAVGSGAPTGGNHLWSPNVETVLKYKSNDLTSMLQNNQQNDQLNVPSPITMEADVKVQAFRDETLRVKFEHTKFYSQNEEVSVSNAHRILDMISSENGHGRHAAHIFKTSLEQPMMIQIKNGQAKDVLVSKNELDCVSKIKLMLVKDLMQNVENQQLKVVKKESIMTPFDLSPQAKKINLNMI